MPTFRITYRADHAYPRKLLLQDLDAERVRYSGQQTTLWEIREVIGQPRWIVTLRGRSRDFRVDAMCPHGLAQVQPEHPATPMPAIAPAAG